MKVFGQCHTYLLVSIPEWSMQPISLVHIARQPRGLPCFNSNAFHDNTKKSNRNWSRPFLLRNISDGKQYTYCQIHLLPLRLVLREQIAGASWVCSVRSKLQPCNLTSTALQTTPQPQQWRFTCCQYDITTLCACFSNTSQPQNFSD